MYSKCYMYQDYFFRFVCRRDVVWKESESATSGLWNGDRNSSLYDCFFQDLQSIGSKVKWMVFFLGQVFLTCVKNASRARPALLCCSKECVALPATCRLNIRTLFSIFKDFDPNRTNLWVHPDWHVVGNDVRLCCGAERSVSGGRSLSASELTPDCRSAPYAVLPELSDKRKKTVK